MKLASMQDIEDFAEEIRETLGGRVVDIILYGSYARDDYTPGSDIDLIVLVEEGKQGDEDRIFDIVEDYRSERDLMFSPRIYTEKEFNSKRKEGYRFHKNVAKEGVHI